MFLYAGVSKLLHYEKTYQQMWNQPFDTRFAPFLTWFIPVLEIAICAMLAIPKLRKWGLYAATSLMAVFTVYVGIIWFGRDGFKVPCSCGGFTASLDWPQHFWFNVFFVVLGLIAIFLHRKNTLENSRKLLAA